MFDKKTYALLKLIYKRGRITNEEADAFSNDEKWHGLNARAHALLIAKFITNWYELTEADG